MGKMRRKKKQLNVGLTLHRTVCYVVLILITIIAIFPFVSLIANSTRAHADIQKGFSLIPGGSFIVNIKTLLNDDNMPIVSALKNSVLVAGITAIVTTYFSALTAFAIHAYDFKFKKVAFTFIMLIMMVPSQVSALGFVNLMRDFDLLDSFIPLIIPSIAAPVVFFFMKQYLESVLPLEIVDASRIDGASEFRTFNKVVLPIIRPAMAVQGIFAFVGSWNNYFIPALILNSDNKKTLPLLIAQLRSADFSKFDMGSLYMMIAFAIIPVIVVYLILSKKIVGGVTAGGVKG